VDRDGEWISTAKVNVNAQGNCNFACSIVTGDPFRGDRKKEKG